MLTSSKLQSIILTSRIAEAETFARHRTAYARTLKRHGIALGPDIGNHAAPAHRRSGSALGRSLDSSLERLSGKLRRARAS